MITDRIGLHSVLSPLFITLYVGGAVASWLVRSSPDRAVRVRALGVDIVLCSWARHLTLTVPLSTQVYKWVPANLMLRGNPSMDWHPIQVGVEMLRGALGFSVLRIWPIFDSVFRFLCQRTSVFRFWCFVRFAGFLRCGLWFSVEWG